MPEDNIRQENHDMLVKLTEQFAQRMDKQDRENERIHDRISESQKEFLKGLEKFQAHTDKQIESVEESTKKSIEQLRESESKRGKVSWTLITSALVGALAVSTAIGGLVHHHVYSVTHPLELLVIENRTMLEDEKKATVALKVESAARDSASEKEREWLQTMANREHEWMIKINEIDRSHNRWLMEKAMDGSINIPGK